MRTLDPHSVYVSAQYQVAVDESMRGNFVGIGINYYIIKVTLVVIKPTENDPSEKQESKQVIAFCM